FYVNSRTKIAEVKDGTSHTIMFGERYHNDPEFDRIYPAYPIGEWGGWAWVNPANSVADYLIGGAVPINYKVPPSAPVGSFTYIDDRLTAMGSGHASGANVAMCDGSARFLPDNTPVARLIALCTRAGGEIDEGGDRRERSSVSGQEVASVPIRFCGLQGRAIGVSPGFGHSHRQRPIGSESSRQICAGECVWAETHGSERDHRCRGQIQAHQRRRPRRSRSRLVQSARQLFGQIGGS